MRNIRRSLAAQSSKAKRWVNHVLDRIPTTSKKEKGQRQQLNCPAPFQVSVEHTAALENCIPKGVWYPFQ